MVTSVILLLILLCCIRYGSDEERILDVVPRRDGARNSELRLRRRVGQAAHTLINPQVECTGVVLCVSRE